jgi:2-polyprenyl-3-methyl-5-hydroxy-6-metoxy-1,4-benzoquinol methylase
MILPARKLVETMAGPAVDWEEPNCLLCGQRHWAQLVEAPDSRADGTGYWFAIVQCQDCGLCFTNPRPTRETIGQFYPNSYEPHRLPQRSRRRRPASSSWGRVGDLRNGLPWHGQGRLLDFGCGGGSFLARMAHQGWHVTGLDMSDTTVQRVRSELNLPVLAGTLPHPDLQPESFDVVTMWQSLEHVHEPLEALREAHRLLVPDGKLIVAVPNIDSLPFEWFGAEWFGLDLPRHLAHFSPWTLTLILQRAGFQVGPIRMLRHSKWLRASAQQAARRPRVPAWKRWLCSKALARVAACYSGLIQQTDCMLAIAEK